MNLFYVELRVLPTSLIFMHVETHKKMNSANVSTLSAFSLAKVGRSRPKYSPTYNGAIEWLFMKLNLSTWLCIWFVGCIHPSPKISVVIYVPLFTYLAPFLLPLYIIEKFTLLAQDCYFYVSFHPTAISASSPLLSITCSICDAVMKILHGEKPSSKGQFRKNSLERKRCAISFKNRDFPITREFNGKYSGRSPCWIYLLWLPWIYQIN